MSTEQFNLLDQLVILPLKTKGADVFIFGSRATNKNHPHSDVDLLYRLPSNTSLPLGMLSKIKEDIEESRFPFLVDLVIDSELAAHYRPSVEAQMIRV